MSRYQVKMMEAPSLHRGGAAFFLCKAERFSFEALYLHFLNVFIFQLVKGRYLYQLVGCCIAPDTDLTIEDTVTSIGRRP